MAFGIDGRLSSRLNQEVPPLAVDHIVAGSSRIFGIGNATPSPTMFEAAWRC